MKKFLVTVMTVVFLGTFGCRATPKTPEMPTKTPEPTPTAAPLTLAQNDCIELTTESVFYKNSTDGSLNYWVSDGSIPERTKFIYMGARVGDRLFVLYGDRQGWVLANYIKMCE